MIITMDVDCFSPFTAATATAIIFITLVVSYVWPSIRTHLSLRRFPRVGIDTGLFGFGTAAAKQQFFHSGEKLVEEGYKTYRDGPFAVQTTNLPRLIIPPKYAEETSDLPDTMLSHKVALLDRFLAPYTGMDSVRFSSTHRDICKVQLTQNLDQLLPYMKEEADRRLSGLHGTSEAAFQTTLEAISQITSRVLINDISICRSHAWLDALLNYPEYAAAVAAKLRPVPPSLRSIVYPWLPATKRLKDKMGVIRDTLTPVFSKRLKAETKEAPPDILRWLMEADPYATPKRVIGNILFLVIAAIHTSTFTTTHALFDLCAMPDVQSMLREEAAEILGVDGVWTLARLRQLRKMDSFLKESHRINSPGVLNYNRLVRRDLGLRDGTKLPAGALVCVAGAARSKDAALYDSPYEFRPLRYYVDEKANKNRKDDLGRRNLFTSTAAGDSWFGSGPQACPGRWYAEAQIKLVLVTLLLKYNLVFPDGQKERPKDLKADEKILPDRNQKIVFLPLP